MNAFPSPCIKSVVRKTKRDKAEEETTVGELMENENDVCDEEMSRMSARVFHEEEICSILEQAQQDRGTNRSSVKMFFAGPHINMYEE